MKNIKRIQRKRSWIETHIKPFWWKQGTVSKWRRKRTRKEVLSGLPGEKGELGKTQMTTLSSPPVGEIMKAAHLPSSLWDQQKYNKMRKTQRRLMTLQSPGKKKKVQNNWKKEKEEINKKRLTPWAKMIQFPLNMGPAPCVNMPLCKPARGLGIGKLRHTWCSQHPRTALNPTGVGSGGDGPSSIHAKSHTGHWFRKAKTLGPCPHARGGQHLPVLSYLPCCFSACS